MKTIKLEPLRAINNKQMVYTDPKGEVKDLYLTVFLEELLFKIPHQYLTLEDSVRAQSYFCQVANQKANGILSLEDAEYDWVKGKITKFAHLLAGLNAVVIEEAINNLEGK